MDVSSVRKVPHAMPARAGLGLKAEHYRAILAPRPFLLVPLPAPAQLRSLDVSQYVHTWKRTTLFYKMKRLGITSPSDNFES